jgi:TPP-dependent pyruvate/acetoin dehydrogenase alpha subunit
MPTIAVDGRDVIAVYRVIKEAISSARKGHGPTLVDCVNFVTPGTRGKDERDPVSSFRGYLKRHNAWSDDYLAIEESLRKELGVTGRRR